MSTKTKKRVSRKERRRNLWVVESGRMKQYGDENVNLIPGQIIRRSYKRNDVKLLEMGYVRPVEEHEDFKKCRSCGTLWLGTATTGPYKSHQLKARHDQAVSDLDTGKTAPDGRKHVNAQDNPDGKSDWDLEPDGTPEPTKELAASKVVDVRDRSM